MLVPSMVFNHSGKLLGVTSLEKDDNEILHYGGGYFVRSHHEVGFLLEKRDDQECPGIPHLVYRQVIVFEKQRLDAEVPTGTKYFTFEC
jgi:hypothetical protein